MILKADNIHKSYHQETNSLHVLKGISLNIKEGEVVAIVGPSGAGKSTLLHILGGLDEPDEGKVVLEEENIYKLNDRKRAVLRNQKISFIFQFYHLLPEFNALENVLLPLLVKENLVNPDKFKSKGLDLLERVGLKQRAGHKPHQLSGGEQQRVAIARALINTPRIILCDEPTGNLDSESGQKVIELLMDLNKKNKQALAIVTHDEGLSAQAHRTVHIHDGKLI